jgi:hypothetical protein
MTHEEVWQFFRCRNNPEVRAVTRFPQMASAQPDAPQPAAPQQQQASQPAQMQPGADSKKGQQQAQSQTTVVQFTDFASI